jgi:hypothetical protein
MKELRVTTILIGVDSPRGTGTELTELFTASTTAA